MASSNFLDDVLNTEADESAVSALVGSLQSQLSSQTSQASQVDANATSNSVLLANSHLIHAATANGATPPQQVSMAPLNSVDLAGNAPLANNPATEVSPTGSLPNGNASVVSTTNQVQYSNGNLNATPLPPGLVMQQNSIKTVQQQQPAGVIQSKTVVMANNGTIQRPQVQHQINNSIPNVPGNVQMVAVNPGAVRGPVTTNLAPVLNSPARQAAPRVVIAPQQVVATRPGQVGITFQTLQGLQAVGGQGHLLVKTENGQFQLLRVGPGPIPGTAVAASGPLPAQATVQQAAPIVSPVVTQQPATPASPSFRVQAPAATPAPVSQTIVVTPNATPTSTTSVAVPANNAAAATTTTSGTGQMTPDTAKIKCKNFLSTLLRLANEQPENVANNVRELIQGLVDAKVDPEDFTNKLQRELNSSPQPCLVPFLRKSLPFLRHSLATKELTIEGIRPPPIASVSLPQTPSTPVRATVSSPQIQAQQAQHQFRSPAPPPVRVSAPSPAATPRPARPAAPSKPAPKQTKPATTKPGDAGTPSGPGVSAGAVSSPAAIKSAAAASAAAKAVASKEKKAAGFSSSLVGLSGDDDINDVAAMGGVNLAEETQRILGSTETIGTQIRSCKDETFLAAGPLHRRIAEIASRHGIAEISPDVVTLISHATQERLKTMIEKLGVIAEHRMEVVKTDARYEVLQDVKGQLKFLEELDKLEQRRHSEMQREMLMKAAKSRSKAEDPEQAKLKAKAKEMQKAELEEMRHRDANLTALQAIGIRKKPRLDVTGTPGTFNQVPLRPRVKRVNLRDMLFLLEEERETVRSPLLYKAYFK